MYKDCVENKFGDNMKKFILFLCILVLLNACVTLRTSEKYEYRELKPRLMEAGLQEKTIKNATLAALLNILPGVGNYYLGQYLNGITNTIFWPTSILWGIPEAAISANTINVQATLNYYKYGGGKYKLAEFEARKMQKEQK